MRAYLDIETSFDGRITVVGIYRPGQGLIQLVSPDITREAILNFLDGTEIIVTYNGSRFDLPLIHKHFDLDLTKNFDSYDLMYDCWRFNLYGGLKAVEITLGIERELPGLSGYDAVKLWALYENYGDGEALETLLKYNKEDVVNLPLIEEYLRSYS
ncbi:MAG: ribonuclease H-like domain-containing protein [Candidatus Subteraquimicrobiales bacterium]|nr:ribonuclease H-like domain-containing protein [Candidatus Subteraquimicrobiales bacterium]